MYRKLAACEASQPVHLAALPPDVRKAFGFPDRAV
jgi:hypothetical protein